MHNDYTESIEEATQLARVALPMASACALPANPVNYAVLYEYVAGQNSELCTALDHLREDRCELSNEQVQSLYNDYVSMTDEQAVQNVRQALSSIVKSTRGSLDKVGRESQAYSENLGDAASQLQAGIESVTTADIIVRLIDETVRMQVASQVMQEELAQTNEDLSRLRTEFKRVRRESLVDPLTGIRNRRAFDISLNECCEQAKIGGEALCMLLVDIDHFKKVNDSHGHVLGDAVLKQVASAIDESVRGGDVLARYGGEEFVVLLPNTPMEGAERVADNICNKVRNLKMDSRTVGKNIGQVTVSVGVALFYAEESREQFVARADTALYRAKESGRNRVCTHSVQKKLATGTIV
ncbi:diguanylate cyclase [Beggiatoa alba]|nr:diguanylate cyclase [Beggiatoa alba]